MPPACLSLALLCLLLFAQNALMVGFETDNVECMDELEDCADRCAL
jgi:hypothetical protein